MKYQLDAAGNLKLLENPIQIVADGMFGDVECLGDVAILHALCHQSSHLALSRREQIGSVALGQSRPEVGKSVEQKLDLRVVRPDLPVVDATDALGQRLEGIATGKNTPRPAAEGIDHALAIGGLQQNNGSRPGMGATHALQYA